MTIWRFSISTARSLLLRPHEFRRVIQVAGRSLAHGGIRQLSVDLRFSAERRARRAGDYKKWAALYDTPTPAELLAMRKLSQDLPSRPLISILMPTYDPPLKHLTAAIESVIAQTYENWELCIADDNSSRFHVREVVTEYARRDARIKLTCRTQNGGIAIATNSALDLAIGDWVTFLDHDDLLAPQALFCLVDAINANPGAELLYSDEDKIDDHGQRVEPHFKTDWNYDLLLSQNFLGHLVSYRRERVVALGGFRSEIEGAQDHDLALRYIDTIAEDAIVHLPHVLYHWRIHSRSTASGPGAKAYAARSAAKAIQSHLDRRGVSARVEPAPAASGMHRVVYTLDEQDCHTTIVIPTKNALDQLKNCVESLVERTIFPSYDLLIVDNGTDDAATLAYLEGLPSRASVTTTVLRDSRPFNFSVLNNCAVAASKGRFVALLNDDTEVVTPDWLREMVSQAQRRGVGCVGARLWYPDRTLQHGGVILGIGGVAGHAHKGLPKGQVGHFCRAVLLSRFSAVTAACLVVSKAIYQSVGGFDERLSVAFNDVDFCLRVRELGYANLWTPYAELIHLESKSRGREDNPEKIARFEAEVAFMKQRWGEALVEDPQYNPNLSLESENFELAFPPRVNKPWRRLLRND